MSKSIENFIQKNRQNIFSTDIPKLRQYLESLEPEDLNIILRKGKIWNKSTVVLVSVLFGWVGFDRILFQNVWIGFLKLLTLAGFGFWWVIDWFILWNTVKKHNVSRFIKTGSTIILLEKIHKGKQMAQKPIDDDVIDVSKMDVDVEIKNALKDETKIIEAGKPVFEGWENNSRENEETGSMFLNEPTWSIPRVPEKKSFWELLEEPFVEVPIPNWEHSYIYSTRDIIESSKLIQNAYLKIRSLFLEGKRIDLSKSTNYAFTLLFNLVETTRKEAKTNPEVLLELEYQLKRLGTLCAKTLNYSPREIIHLYESFDTLPESLVERYNMLHDSRFMFVEGWGYGIRDNYFYEKIKNKRSFTRQEQTWINLTGEPYSSFLEEKEIFDAVLDYYLIFLNAYDSELQSRDSNVIEDELEMIRLSGEQPEEYKRISSWYYSCLFNSVENAVREQYGHKRKLSVKFVSRTLTDEFLNKRGELILQTIKKTITKLSPPSEKIQIKLNEKNVSRWKDEFSILKNDYKPANPNSFYTGIIQLEKMNLLNPNVEHIFYEAAKVVAPNDHVQALKYYAKYIYHDLQSKKIDQKPLTKSLEKKLFPSIEVKTKYKGIIETLMANRNITKALEDIESIYKPVRREIRLSEKSIKNVESSLDTTVELLNTYLNSAEQSQKVTAETSGPTAIEHQSKNVLMQEEVKLIKQFEANNLYLSSAVAAQIAEESSTLKGILIDGINEKMAEHLDDDVLIEESDNGYYIERVYFETIKRIGLWQ